MVCNASGLPTDTEAGKELEKAGAVYIADSVEDLGILASPNDEETTENVESVRNIIPDQRKSEEI